MAARLSPPVLGTGLSGLVGSRLAKDFGDQYDFDNLDVSHPTRPVDITNFDQVVNTFAASTAHFVIHFAAFTDVTKAWEQRDDKSGMAYRINVVGTENIAKACELTGKHLIHISTAYVFDGQKSSPYTEEDALCPIEWYGQTKAWAEEVVTRAPIPWTILRIDQPFRSDAFPKVDLLHRIVKGLQEKTLYPQFTNHIFGPTYINDFAKVIDWVMRSKTTGLFHATAGEAWTDFDFATMVNEVLQLHGEVKPGDLTAYLKTLSRPYQPNTALNSEKLRAAIDFELQTIRAAVAQVEKN